MVEIWKTVPAFGCHYEASNLGRIRSKKRTIQKRTRNGGYMTQTYQARILSQNLQKGYWKIRFGVDGVKYTDGAHRLIAMAFHGMPKPGEECCHNNGNPSDNRPENLRWDTHLANNRDRKTHGNYPVGSRHPMSKLTETDVVAIRLDSRGIDIVAKVYGVNRSAIHKIRAREVWTHV